MTRKEFDDIRFTAGMFANLEGCYCPIVSVDFDDYTVLIETFNSENKLTHRWVKCECLSGLGVM